MEHEMHIPPRHPSAALDGDFDEELHTDVSAPPPPPPPPRKGGNGNNLNERRTMEQQHPQQPPSPGFGHQQSPHKGPSQQHQREPLNSLMPSQRVSHGPHTPKSQSGCDSSVQHSEMSFASSKPDAQGSVTMRTPTIKNKNLNRPSPKPPKPPTQAGSLSIEYSSRIDSFHQCMLDNIEKETMMIRNQGSFQIHEKHLTSNKASRRQSSNNHQGSHNQHGETSENRNGSGTPNRRTSSSNRTGSAPATTMVGDHSNVSLLKETMNDISVAAASTMEHLKSAIQHTKERAAKNGVVVPVGVKLPINLNAVTNPIVCGNIDDATFTEEDYKVDYADDGESGVLSPTNTARNQQAKEKKAASDQQRSSSTGRLSQFASLDKVSPDMLRTSSGTDLVKKMSDAFKKGVVAVQDAAAAAGNQSNNSSAARTNSNSNNNHPQHSDEKKDDDENAWGVGHLLANAVGWEGNNDEESDDGRSRATYDTWDEENSVLRRLGSWGTVNSQFTAGTAGTALTYDTEGPSVIGSVSMAVAAAAAAKANGGVVVGPDTPNPKNGDQLVVPGTQYVPKQDAHIVDDDGSLINPVLIEATMKKKEKLKKGRRRRKKLVKFDYPPIKSLRQYTRPDPEDLPNLFFTEEELDQIEDDRYSTMSSDDIEIVAVSSAERKDRDDAIDEKMETKKKKSPRNSSEGKRKEPDFEPGFRPVKGRSGTPDRRRTCDSDSSQKKSPKNSEETDQDQTTKSSPRRLVKGVQIYLRERSTGT